MVSVGSGERIVAGWILERRLGSGGYGEVWQARRRHVDLVRALKLIPIVSEGAFESWRHEIGRLEALNHPNVVRFYDADIVSEGLYRDYAWIATELCERSLADGLRAREGHVLPPAEGERLLDAMLAALAAAHAAGMVHRDLKPANIVRHRDGTWKLCDFGTARLVPADGTHPLTQVIGTSPYMSPAAHRGQQNQAADLYALGVTVHEALRGERLHPRSDGMTDSEYVKVVLDTPPTIAPDLPGRWRTAVAALIGVHGALDAAQLASWFSGTRGERPPPTPSTAGAAGATGATVAAGSNGANGAGGSTGATEAAGAAGPGAVGAATGTPTGPTALAAAPAAAAAPVARRVHIPAPPSSPRPPAPGTHGATGSNGWRALRPPGAAGPAHAPVGAPAPAPRPGTAGPPAQRPLPPRPAPVRPAAPPSVVPAAPPIWVAAAVDPTAPLGRRIFAVLVDAFLIFLVAGVLFFGAVVNRYQEVPPPQGSDSVEAACDAYESFESCFIFGNTIYVSATSSLSFAPFVVVVGLLVLVLLQGITGATVGKVLTGLRVVGPDGRPPGLPRALLRTVFLVFDGFPWVVPFLGWLVAVSNARHRRVGDLAAGTMVVRRRALPYIRR